MVIEGPTDECELHTIEQTDDTDEITMHRMLLRHDNYK
jgi:hypothetical protein